MSPFLSYRTFLSISGGAVCSMGADAMASIAMASAPIEQTAPPLMLKNVLYERKGDIAYVTVNRPKVLNALSTPTWADLRTAFEAARDDSDVRGVVLTG